MVALRVSSFFPRHLKYRNQKEISDAHTNASFILKWLCISGTCTWELRSCIVRSIAYWIDFLYYFMSCQAAVHARIVLQYFDLYAFSRFAPGLRLAKASLSEVMLWMWRLMWTWELGFLRTFLSCMISSAHCFLIHGCQAFFPGPRDSLYSLSAETWACKYALHVRWVVHCISFLLVLCNSASFSGW